MGCGASLLDMLDSRMIWFHELVLRSVMIDQPDSIAVRARLAMVKSQLLERFAERILARHLGARMLWTGINVNG